MPKNPCPLGRRDAAALASMNVRARVTAFGVEYLARPLAVLRLASDPGKVSPRFQPRNEIGRYVSYAFLRTAIAFEWAIVTAEAEGTR